MVDECKNPKQRHDGGLANEHSPLLSFVFLPFDSVVGFSPSLNAQTFSKRGEHRKTHTHIHTHTRKKGYCSFFSFLLSLKRAIKYIKTYLQCVGFSFFLLFLGHNRKQSVVMKPSPVSQPSTGRRAPPRSFVITFLSQDQFKKTQRGGQPKKALKALSEPYIAMNGTSRGGGGACFMGTLCTPCRRADLQFLPDMVH